MGSWEYVRKIFDEVVDASVDERGALLEMRCGQDIELRDAVERLLVAADCEDFLIDGNLVGDFLGSADGADELDRPLIQKHAFDEGQTLAERFRVVRYIGRGGMGEVYEAYDPDLGRSVALKTVRSEFVGDALSLRRFMREIRMALAVTHPNVCRIYDVHRHLGEDGNEVLFLSMELLKGETVAEFIKRRGKISTDEAGPIVRQMCDSLGAIHEKGIVHRDFTPKNVMLDGDRVVVTDFGLARPQIQESGVHSMTVTGQVLGVPDYMAPEQLAGAEVTAKADVYALGVIAYEMVTGRKPFSGETALEVAHAKTSGSMTDPAKYAIELPDRWRSGLLASIQIEPAKRPTPGQLSSVIGGETELALRTIVGALDSQPAKITPGGAYRYAVAVALFLALAALLVYGSRFKGDGGETSPAAVVKNIVVLPFQTHGESADLEAFSAGLIDSLTSGLSQYQGEHDLAVVPTSEVSRREISTAGEAREAFDADYAVEGSIYEDNGRRRLLMKLIDTAEMRQVDTYRFEGPADNTWSLQDNTLARLAVMLDLESRPDRVDEQPVPKPGAHGFYLVGNGYLQRNDKMENIDSAITVFERALELDPDYSPAHAGLAEAYWYKFERTKEAVWLNNATEKVEFALKLAPSSARALRTRGSIRYSGGQYTTSISDFKLALEAEPNRAESLIGLGKALNKIGQKTAAEATYQRALSTVPFDWRLHKQIGLHYFAHGEYDKSAVALESLTALSPDNAQGFTNLGTAYYYLGRNDQARQAWQQAIAIEPRRAALSNLANLLVEERLFDEAVPILERAIKLDSNDFRTWGNLGITYGRVGRDAEARESFQQALDLIEDARKINPERSDIYSYAAKYAALMGDTKPAEDWLDKAISSKSADPRTLLRIASTAEDLGHRSLALKWIEKALLHGLDAAIVSNSNTFEDLVKDSRYRNLVSTQY